MGVCAAAVERARSSRSRGAVLARPHTSSPWAAEGGVGGVEMGGEGVGGGGDGGRECVVQ